MLEFNELEDLEGTVRMNVGMIVISLTRKIVLAS